MNRVGLLNVLQVDPPVVADANDAAVVAVAEALEVVQ